MIRDKLLRSAARCCQEDGQQHLHQLMYAPLTFLSFGMNSDYFPMVMASAVGFLEGYSTEDMETNFKLVSGNNGMVVAHSDLMMVPHRTSKVPSNKSSPIAPGPSTTLDQRESIAKISHVISISRPYDQQSSGTAAERSQNIEALRESFINGGCLYSHTIASILNRIDSPEEAQLVVSYSLQTGISLPRAAVLSLVQRMERKDREAARRIASQFEFELDLTSTIFRMEDNRREYQDRTLGTRQLGTARHRSRLDRIRGNK